ncbi:MAG: hypothetical protein ACXVH3_21105 [Solirubrobacteraceae bacterium]
MIERKRRRAYRAVATEFLVELSETARLANLAVVCIRRVGDTETRA